MKNTHVASLGKQTETRLCGETVKVFSGREKPEGSSVFGGLRNHSNNKDIERIINIYIQLQEI